MFLGGTHQAQTERESRGYIQVFKVLVPFVAAAGVVQFVHTTQEQPFHPGPAVIAALPNVAPAGVVKSFTTVQEQPFHPGSLRISQIQNAAQAGIVKSPINIQEQPSHPGPSTWNFIPVVRPPSVQFWQTAQELPQQFGSWTVPPVTFFTIPSVVSTATRYIPTTLETPFHPGPSVSTSIPNVAAADVVRGFETTQEIPGHPGPYVLAALPNVAAPNVVASPVTVQVQPVHPGPSTWNFIQVIRPPSVQFWQTAQELPRHPLSSISQSFIAAVAPTVIAPGIRYFTTGQESPFHPGTSAWGINPLVGGPITAFYQTPQEIPDDIGTIVTESLVQAAVIVTVPPSIKYLATEQEQPESATLSFSVLIFGEIQILAPPTVSAYEINQEQPDNPGPQIFPPVISVPPVFASPGVRYFATKQESPYHPGSYSLQLPGPNGNGPPVTSGLLLRQLMGFGL